jgi:hypothetical protein
VCRSVSGVSVSRVKTKQKMRRVFNNTNSGDAVSRVRKTNPRLFIKRLVFTNKRRRGNSVFKVFDSRVAVTRLAVSRLKKRKRIAYLNVFDSDIYKKRYIYIKANSVFKVFDSRVAVTRVGKKLCIAYLNVAVMPFQSFLKKEAYCTVAY